MSVISSFEVRAYTDSLNALTGVAKSAVENAISGIEYEDVADLRAKLLDAIEPFVTASTDTAAALAAEFYDSVREQATGSRYGANPVSNHEPQATEGAIRAFLQGVVEGKPLADVLGKILGRVDWEVKHAAGECVIENAKSDPLCKRYARVPTGAETCPFCLMLASRGFVYLNAKSAGADGNGHYHANCDCRIVPGFDGMDYEGYDPDALYFEWRDSTHAEYMERRKDEGKASHSRVSPYQLEGNDELPGFENFSDVKKYIYAASDEDDLERRFDALEEAYGLGSKQMMSQSMKNAVRHTRKRL